MKGPSNMDWHMVMRDPKNSEPREDLAPECYGPYRGEKYRNSCVSRFLKSYDKDGFLYRLALSHGTTEETNAKPKALRTLSLSSKLDTW